MRLGITVDMSGPNPKLDMDRVMEAERLGFSQVWTGEAYSTDAVTPVTWILARTTKIMAGTGMAAKRGILIKDADVLALMGKCKIELPDEFAALAPVHGEAQKLRDDQSAQDRGGHADPERPSYIVSRAPLDSQLGAEPAQHQARLRAYRRALRWSLRHEDHRRRLQRPAQSAGR